MRLTCVLMVDSATTSRPAISALDRPCAISTSTSVSRSVRSPYAACADGSTRGASDSLENSVISRRVTEGASSASPAATTRTPSAS
ncbi:hypothetical protein SALBM217S_06999 [Streptomyces griseoloalbus]